MMKTMAFQSSKNERRSSEGCCVLFRGEKLRPPLRLLVDDIQPVAQGCWEGWPVSVRGIRGYGLMSAICPRRKEDLRAVLKNEYSIKTLSVVTAVMLRRNCEWCWFGKAVARQDWYINPNKHFFTNKSSRVT